MRQPVRIPASALQRALQSLQLSQTDLAALSELPYERVRRMMRTDSNPNLDDALRVANALQMSVEELFQPTSDRALIQRPRIAS